MPSTFRSLSQPSRLTAPFTQGSLWSALLRRWERYPTCEKRTHRCAVRPSACQKSLADERPQAPWKRLTAEGGSWRVPVSRSEARNKIKSFSPATCASEKILLSPQVCESSAAGGRCVCAGAASTLSKNPDCNQEQTGSRTYMSEKTAKRNEDNRSLHFHVANFFKFMAANLSFTQFVT